jgi:FlaA1/EpsC-like NDP-sugar epimerase
MEKTMCLQDKVVVVTGGTGSLGKVLVRRLLSGEMGHPAKIIVFSRDEAKQHTMRLSYMDQAQATDEVIYENFRRVLDFRIGDVRDLNSVRSAVRGADVVFAAAALKQVPTCEYFPHEAVRTNIEGAQNLVLAAQEMKVGTVVGISTDKACKPVNVMGLTKAIQERIFNNANLLCPETRFLAVRYGNVLASRGSVIPLFIEQIRRGGPVTITTDDMTRFLLSLDQSVDTVFEAVRVGKPGETVIPRVPAARITDVAKALIGDRPVEIVITGVRPGEKIDEILVSDEEAARTFERGDFYVIGPILPEISDQKIVPALSGEYSSSHDLLDLDGVRALLEKHKLTVESAEHQEGELIR